MRIVHVTDTFLPVMGGIETQVDRLATQQAAQGHEVFVLTTTMSKPSRGVRFSREALAGVSEGALVEADGPAQGMHRVKIPAGLQVDALAEHPYTVIRSPWQNPLALPIDPHAPSRFKRLIEVLKPDVVHVHVGELTPIAMSMLLGLRRGAVPTVISIHSVWSTFPTIPLFKAGFRLSGLSEAPFLWLANSELTASRARKVIDPRHVEVHNNSVDPEGWLVPAQPHEGLVVATATRFAPRKRVPETLRMLRSVGDRLGLNRASDSPEADSPLKVVIAGEGPGLKSARLFVESHGMSNWVELPGRLSREELIELYSRSDIYLAPSVKDAFSISGLEARAAGLAILSRSQSGFGAAVLDGVEGRSVEDDDALAQVLVEWAGAPSVVESYKEHNRTVPMPYTWEVALPGFEDAYRRAAELLNEGSR